MGKWTVVSILLNIFLILYLVSRFGGIVSPSSNNSGVASPFSQPQQEPGGGGTIVMPDSKKADNNIAEDSSRSRKEEKVRPPSFSSKDASAPSVAPVTNEDKKEKSSMQPATPTPATAEVQRKEAEEKKGSTPAQVVTPQTTSSQSTAATTTTAMAAATTTAAATTAISTPLDSSQEKKNSGTESRQNEPSTTSSNGGKNEGEDPSSGDGSSGGGSVGVAKLTGSGGVPCFKNKIFWKPASCSRASDVLAKLIERSTSEESRQRWRVAHIGARDMGYKLAEAKDSFSDFSFGTLKLGQFLFKRASAAGGGGGSDFCGACCECVSLDPNIAPDNTTVIPSHEIFALVPQPFSRQVSSFFTPGSNVTLVTLPRNDPRNCPQELIDDVKKFFTEESQKKSHHHFDVVSIDAWQCDPRVVMEALYESVLKPGKVSVLQFTMMNGEANYAQIITALDKVGYTCGFPTEKPTTRRFRGMRAPMFPLFTYVSGCWRPIFNNFKGDRYHTVCFKRSDGMLGAIFGQMATLTHKGNLVGCQSMYRPQRFQKLFVDGAKTAATSIEKP